MQKLSLLDCKYIFFIKTNDFYYPFVAINIKGANIYFNYLLLNEHTSLHFGRKPFIKHSRKSYSVKNIYEREFEKEDFGVIDNYAFKPRAFIEKNRLRRYTQDNVNFLDQNRELIILPLEDYETAGWLDDNKGLGFIAFYLPNKSADYIHETRHYVENSLPQRMIRISLKNESSLIIILHSKNFVNKVDHWLRTIYVILNKHTFADKATMILEPMTQRYDEKVIVMNNGFVNGFNKNANMNIKYAAMEIWGGLLDAQKLIKNTKKK